MEMDPVEMKRWYDGYQIGAEKAIYNPYAVMCTIKRHSFESYWASTNAFENLRQLFMMNFEGLKDDVISAMNDVPVKVNSLRFSNDMHKVECKDDVLTLLCHLCFLSFNNNTRTATIPNYEVRQEFELAVSDTSWSEVTSALSQSEMLIKAVLSSDEEMMAKCIDRVHNQNVYFENVPHSAEEIFTFLGIGKQSKHYNVYIKSLLGMGLLIDATPDKIRGKKYIMTKEN